MKHVNGKDLIEPVTCKGDITKAETQRIVNAVIEAITKGPSSDGKVNLTGFDSIEVHNRVPRIKRNPSAGESIQILRIPQVDLQSKQGIHSRYEQTRIMSV